MPSHLDNQKSNAESRRAPLSMLPVSSPKSGAKNRSWVLTCRWLGTEPDVTAERPALSLKPEKLLINSRADWASISASNFRIVRPWYCSEREVFAMTRGDRLCTSPKWASRWLSCTFCALMLLAPRGVHGDNDKKTRKYTPNVKSSASEISSRNQSLLALYSAEIETAADKIISRSPSPAARRQALVWKAEAIPVMQTSLLNSDPIAAVLDTWAFVFQMTAFMDRPEWKNVIGDLYPVVTETFKNMNVQMERLVQSAAPKANIAATRERVRSWADANPIQDSLASRQSADPDIIKKVGQTNFGTLGSIKELAESMGDLSARLDAYNLYLPKQARWQAELFLEDLKRDTQVNSALSDIRALSNTAATLDSERLSVQQFVHQERQQTLYDLQRERIATLAAVHAERLGVIGDLHAERLAATADLRGERQKVLDALSGQEVAVVGEMRTTSEKEIQTLSTKGRDLIDHLFLRALEFMLLTLVLFSLVAWILLRRFSTRQADRTERLFRRAA